MKNLIFIGDSHLIGLIKAARRLENQAGTAAEADYEIASEAFQTYDVHLPNDTHIIFILIGGGASTLIVPGPNGNNVVSSLYMQQFQAAAGRFAGPITQVYSYVFGNEHSIFAMVEHPIPIDYFVSRDDPGVPAGPIPRQIVPLQVVRRHLAERFMRIVIYCQVLKQIFPGMDIVHCLPPPPIGDEKQVMDNLGLFSDMIDAHGLAPKELRRKTYDLYCQDLRAMLAENGIHTVGVPPGTATDGLLDEQYWEGCAHANHLYGHLMLEQMGIV